MMSSSNRLEVPYGAQAHSSNHHDDGNNSCGRGIKKDIKRTLGTHYKEEVTNFNQKTIGVSIFIFFAAAAPAITFGAVYAKSTNNYIGAVEMLAATAWCGIVYGLIGGQPMMINGGTGPVLAFSTVLYDMSKSLDVPFLTLNAWTGLWVTLLLVLAAIVDLNRIMKHLTRFTDEIFAMLIASIFIIDAVGNPFNKIGVFWYFQPTHKSHSQFEGDTDYNQMATAFLSVVLTFGTCGLAFKFRSMKHSRFFPNQTIRNTICDFAVVTSLLFWCIMANVVFKNIETETLNVPETFAPTFQCCDSTCRTSFPLDCPEQEEAWGRRNWLVNLGDVNGKAWVPFFAIIPALLAFILIFLDDGITWHLINHPSNKLTHGDAYNYDTIIIAIMIGVNSMFGLPWLVAATVRSITHVQALAEKDKHGQIVSVQETRLTHIFIHALVLASIFALSILKLIPVPVLYGVFLFMGVASLATNQFWQRFLMLFMQPSRLPETPFTKYMPHKKLHFFTFIQVVLFALLMVFRSISVIAIAFPIIIKACIPIRSYILPRWFSEDELCLLDAEDEDIDRLVQRLEEDGAKIEEVDMPEDNNAAMNYADDHMGEIPLRSHNPASNHTNEHMTSNHMQTNGISKNYDDHHMTDIPLGSHNVAAKSPDVSTEESDSADENVEEATSTYEAAEEIPFDQDEAKVADFDTEEDFKDAVSRADEPKREIPLPRYFNTPAIASTDEISLRSQTL